MGLAGYARYTLFKNIFDDGKCGLRLTYEIFNIDQVAVYWATKKNGKVAFAFVKNLFEQLGTADLGDAKFSLSIENVNARYHLHFTCNHINSTAEFNNKLDAVETAFLLDRFFLFNEKNYDLDWISAKII